MLWPKIITLHIEFPALTDLVAFVRERADQQDHVDALAVRVSAVKAKLGTSGVRLKTSEEKK